MERRNFLKAACSIPLALSAPSYGNNKFRKATVLVIGAGFSGTSFIQTIRALTKDFKIILVEPNDFYSSCMLSNEWLIGTRDINSISFSIERFCQINGIEWVKRKAISIDHNSKQVHIEDGSLIPYDKCVVSSGVGFDYTYIPPESRGKIRALAHGWSGSKSRAALKNSIDRVKDGDSIVICAPKGNYKCPPGPYERASLIAEHIIKKKIKAKVVLLDEKKDFAKSSLFKEAWERLYSYGKHDSVIEYYSSTDLFSSSHVEFDSLSADTPQETIINFIPRQKASDICYKSGLVDDTGWCPVRVKNSQSTLRDDIYIIGDSANIVGLPKSAFAASQQGRNCAIGMYSELTKFNVLPFMYKNICFSICATDYAICTFTDYETDIENNLLEITSARNTPLNQSRETLKLDYKNGISMFETLVRSSGYKGV